MWFDMIIFNKPIQHIRITSGLIQSFAAGTLMPQTYFTIYIFFDTIVLAAMDKISSKQPTRLQG